MPEIDTELPQFTTELPQVQTELPQVQTELPPMRTTRPRPPRDSASRLRRAELLLDGTEADPEIVTAMERYGMVATKRDAGRALIRAAKTALETQPLRKGSQLGATAAQKQARKDAQRAVGDLVGVCRAVFVGNGAALATLGLDQGKLPEALAKFLLAGERLYEGALSGPQSVRDTLAEFGYPAARLQEGRALLSALRDSDTEQEGTKSAHQDTTPSRTEALNVLNAWAAQYAKLARIALRDRPQKLEALGIRATLGG